MRFNNIQKKGVRQQVAEQTFSLSKTWKLQFKFIEDWKKAL